MVQLLEEGKIPYPQRGPNRLVLFSELLAYLDRRSEQRRAALDRMTKEASEAGLYDGLPGGYAAALKMARKRAAFEDAS